MYFVTVNKLGRALRSLSSTFQLLKKKHEILKLGKEHREAEMRFLRSVTGVTKENRVKNERIIRIQIFDLRRLERVAWTRY
jgi:hypothetical protein